MSYKPIEYHSIIEHDIDMIADRIKSIQNRIVKGKREIYMLDIISKYVHEKEREKIIQLFDV